MANFDRTANGADLPKLEGCYTRGTQYRWNVFQSHLAGLAPNSEVLDIGCGSLKETHYLATRGFRVTGIDLNADRLKHFMGRYDWSGLHTPDLRTITIQQLADEGKRFDAITAFDVVEHLDDLHNNLRAFARMLKPGGLAFVTTPNGRSLSEVYAWIMLRSMRAVGHQLEPGVPHVQTHTPRGWRREFERAGLEVGEWDMAIGPVANSCAVLGMAPLHLGLMGLQVMRVVGRERRHAITAAASSLASASWIARGLKAVDDRTKRLTRPFFTWNLVVLKSGPQPHEQALPSGMEACLR